MREWRTAPVLIPSAQLAKGTRVERCGGGRGHAGVGSLTKGGDEGREHRVQSEHQLLYRSAAALCSAPDSGVGEEEQAGSREAARAPPAMQP